MQDGIDCERIIAGAPIPDERRQSAKQYCPLFRAFPGEIAGHQGFLNFQIVEPKPGKKALGITLVCVEPYCDARYVGRALVHAALVIAQNEGAKSVFAYVDNDNMESQSFFERNSFLRTDRRSGIEYTTKVPDKEKLPLDQILIRAQE
jgi:ribosomal protein S18 acetylase RimI-like enzyme